MVVHGPWNLCTGLIPRSRNKAHKTRLDRISELLNRRASIEEKLFACAERVEKAFSDASQELRVTLEGRMRDIEELDNAVVL